MRTALLLGSLLLAGATAPAQEENRRKLVIDFDKAEVGKPPEGFTTARTGQGAEGSWTVVEDRSAPTGGKCLAQTSADETDFRFPLCVFENTSSKDVLVSVKFKPVSGNVDQAAGIVVRYRDKDTYYVARANALEDNVRFYHVVKGKRTQIASMNAKIDAGTWHTLDLSAKGNHFLVRLDGKMLIEAEDDTLADAGKVGLWTKADSVVHFDDLVIVGGGAPPPPDEEPDVQDLDELQGRAVEEIRNKNYEVAIKYLEKIIAIAAKLPEEDATRQGRLANYNLACALSLSGKKGPALKAFARSLELGFKDWKLIDEDTDLDAIRNEDEFKKVLAFAKNPQKTVEPPAKPAEKGFLGITLVRDAEGAVVESVLPGTPAEAAKLQAGDKILEVDGKPVATFEELIERVGGRKAGEKVKFLVDRDGWRKKFEITLAARPKEEAPPAPKGEDDDDD